MPRRYLTAEQRDRRDEAEQERYNTLYEYHLDRWRRQNEEEGGNPDWEPPPNRIHHLVTSQMERERREAED